MEPMVQAPCTTACFMARYDGRPSWYLAQPHRTHRSGLLYRTAAVCDMTDTSGKIELNRLKPVFFVAMCDTTDRAVTPMVLR